MKASYRQRVVEYVFFIRRMKRDKRAGGHGMYVMNSKVPIFAQTAEVDGVHGLSALACVHAWESSGRILPCREPDKLRWYLAGKAARDWHITEWARGIAEGLLTLAELMADGVPASLLESVRQARNKIIYASPAALSEHTRARVLLHSTEVSA